jgi:hypothetical protein
MIQVEIERRAGRHTIVMRAESIGNDLLVSVFGGDEYHIGGIAVAYPTRSHYRDATTVSVSTLTLPGHKDYIVANSTAERLCKSLNKTTVVCVGIHMQRASAQEIQTAVDVVDAMTSDLIAHLQKESPKKSIRV